MANWKTAQDYYDMVLIIENRGTALMHDAIDILAKRTKQYVTLLVGTTTGTIGTIIDNVSNKNYGKGKIHFICGLEAECQAFRKANENHNNMTKTIIVYGANPGWMEQQKPETAPYPSVNLNTDNAIDTLENTIFQIWKDLQAERKYRISIKNANCYVKEIKTDEITLTTAKMYAKIYRSNKDKNGFTSKFLKDNINIVTDFFGLETTVLPVE